MKFETFFRLISYLAVFCGFLSLWVSGTFGAVATGMFIVVFVLAWRLEDTRFQIGEKLGTALIVLALPVFYFVWDAQLLRSSTGDTWVAGLLARMILCLTAIKLLQKKGDRDWIFLYLMSFFEVLLAAGLSISGFYLLSFVLYLLLTASSIIAFEIRKTSRSVERRITGTKPDPAIGFASLEPGSIRPRRVQGVAVALVISIVVLAIPLFFLLPRVGGAGFGGQQRGMATSGFSDRVTLGQFGRIIEDDRVVMRLRLRGGVTAASQKLYLRGVALDTFDNLTWSKSRTESTIFSARGRQSGVRFSRIPAGASLIDQTIYLEPLDTPVLFALQRPIEFQGGFSELEMDSYGSISQRRDRSDAGTSERISYHVLSDVATPSVADLQNDRTAYTADDANYRLLPKALDPRIAELTTQLTRNTSNRYDKAVAVESHLQHNFGYSLDQKPGGREPLADFLFNVREGHCEYFATAMAVMLRTQGIATRVVNGFHGGEYNSTADLILVRQRHAHAWVEVYFPGEDAWITFDPTPYSGQPGNEQRSGFTATVGKYLEALEAIWIEYFVSFDDRGQRSLGQSVRSSLADYQGSIAASLGLSSEVLTEWLARLRGERGLQASILAVLNAAGAILAAVVLIWLLVIVVRKLAALNFVRRWLKGGSNDARTQVEFYERMLTILKARGLMRLISQTPMEFAHATGNPASIRITEKYQEVRFGGRELSVEERMEVDEMLRDLAREGKDK